MRRDREREQGTPATTPQARSVAIIGRKIGCVLGAGPERSADEDSLEDTESLDTFRDLLVLEELGKRSEEN